jgi:hypothetical protein
MKKDYSVKSPNLADALIMAISLIGDVKIQQDRQYYVKPQFYKEENLFTSAGIR